MRQLSAYLLAATLCSVAPAFAQDDSAEEDSGGLLVRFLENTLSDDNNAVSVIGLEGALSARATIQGIEISDADGVWFRLTDAVLDWNRLALVRGRFSVNALTAGGIEVIRPPLPSTDTDLPSPEAQPFAMPDLPISIEIAELSVGQLDIGQDVLGIAASLSVDGRLTLADGALDTDIQIDRLDRTGDQIGLTASFANETRMIGLDLQVQEAAGGLISTALGLPGQPPVSLTAQGSGPVSDFAADIKLATDGQDRVTGRVELTETDDLAIAFTAGLDGDLRALMQPDFQGFFGPDTRLRVAGQAGSDGALDLSQLSLEAEALSLSGDLALTAETRPSRVNLDIQVGQPGDDVTTLPVSGGQTQLGLLTARARFDAAQSQRWTLDIGADGFSQPGLTLGTGRIEASGLYDADDPATPLRGDLLATLDQLGFADAGLGQAVGPTLTLDGSFTLARGDRLTLSGFELTGRDLQVVTDMTISGLRSGFEVDGRVQAELADLNRVATLAGLPDLNGRLTATLTGRGAPLGKTFDFALEGRGQDLQIGQEMVDALIPGQTDLRLEAGRGPDGLDIRSLALAGEALTLDAKGNAQTGALELDLTAELDDLGRILPEIPGPVTARGTAGQSRGTWRGDLDIAAPGGSTAQLDAVVPPGAGDGLAFDLSVSEPAGGALGALLALPDRPALALTIQGAGAISDLATQIALATEGQDRVTGTVTLRQDPPQEAPTTTLQALIKGDVTPFLDPQLHAFFGPSATISLNGLRQADGQLDLSNLTIDAAALQIDANATLDPENRPLRANLTGRIAPPDGAGQVRLPIPGDPVTLEQAEFDLSLDSQTGQGWTLTALAEGLDHPQAKLERLRLTGDGALELGDVLTASGRVRGGLLGLAMRDPALRQAVGSTLALDGRFDLPGDDTFSLHSWRITGVGIVAQAQAMLGDLSGTQTITAQANLDLADLARFSGLAQRPLGGAAQLALTGSGALTPQNFDGVLTAVLQDVTTGIAQADAVLAGRYDLRIDAATRDGGADLRNLKLTGPALTASASGFVSATEPDLTAQISLDDLGRVVSVFPGPATLDARLNTDQSALLAEVKLNAPNDSFLQTMARLDPDGPIDVSFDGRLNNLERFAPQFPGSVTAKGTANRAGGQWQFQADATGPAAIDATLSGLFDEAAGTIDANAKGRLQLAAANGVLSPISVDGLSAFDLSIRGTPGLDAVSGQITVNPTRIAIPQAQITVNDFGGAITLDAGQANVSLTGGLRSGGTFSIRGPVQLTAPFDGDIAIALNELILTDEVIYRAPVSGQLSFSGPLASAPNLAGRIDIGETEIDIGNIGGASAAAPIPPITHVGETSAARASRDHAGLIKSGNAGQSSFDLGLDLLISAPRKIFVRGRGLDAELGGELVLRGSASNLVPSGQIELIRGILSLLGRRLELSKGLITLQGSLRPYMEFAATSSANSGSATLEMAGELNNLEITITSDPELPEDEALALLLFGNEFSTLSPFKLAQIAAGLLTLRGGGNLVGDTGRDATGADNVNLANDGGGLPSLGVGGYLSDNVYTDVTVNTQGDTELNINLDVTDNLTLKGTVDGAGDNSIGIFFDRDY